MSNNLLKNMNNNCEVKILDGGFSTQISQYVGDNVDGDPLWTARFLFSRPDAVTQTHLDFLRAGSDIIETNTYQASVGGFKKFLNVSDVEAIKLIKLSVQLAQKAVDQFTLENPDAKPIIAGSIGPYGAALYDGSEYTGSYADFTSTEVIKEWHKPRIEALLESGITLLAIETIPCEKEAVALAELLKSYPSVKAWVSFNCKDDQHLAHGEVFHEVAKKVYLLNPEQIIAVGVNCLNPTYVRKLLKPINEGRERTIPLIAYPNSGEKYIGGEWTGSVSLAHIELFLEEWMAVGVRYVGGCCRTRSDQVAAIRDKLHQLAKQ